MIAADFRKRGPRPCTIWRLDEVYLKIAGRMVYLWRAFDAEGEALDVMVQSKRNKHAALKLMRKLLKKFSFVPDRMITDDLVGFDGSSKFSGIASGQTGQASAADARGAESAQRVRFTAAHPGETSIRRSRIKGDCAGCGCW